MQWVEFLKRKMSFSTIYAHWHSYLEIIPNIIGGQLSRVVYYYDGNFTHIIHEQGEMNEFGKIVKKRLKSEPELINQLLQNAMNFQKEAKNFLQKVPSDLSLNKTLEFFSNYLANAVNIPHRLSWAFKDAEEVTPRLLDKLNKIRGISHFVKIDKICIKLMKSLLKDKDKDYIPFVNLINPAEMLKERPWPSKKELVQRRNGWLLKFCDGKIEFVFGEEANKKYSTLLNVKTKKDILEGSVAYSGKVTGEVIVIEDKKKLEKIKSGCVLVTNMTTPDYLPYIKKVIAIITDEGGTTCHASIISRELKIPCIVGTKVATKILKDRDVVEVNAVKGIVKKLK